MGRWLSGPCAVPIPVSRHLPLAIRGQFLPLSPRL